MKYNSRYEIDLMAYTDFHKKGGIMLTKTFAERMGEKIEEEMERGWGSGEGGIDSACDSQ